MKKPLIVNCGNRRARSTAKSINLRLIAIEEAFTMQLLERTITIGSPVQQVFRYVSEPANLPRIWPDTCLVEDIQRLPNGGRRFRWVAKIAGCRCEGISEDIEFAVHQRIVRQIGGGIKGIVTWSFVPDGGNTRLRILAEYTLPPPLLRKQPAESIIKQNERDLDALLASLKARTESQIVALTS